MLWRNGVVSRSKHNIFYFSIEGKLVEWPTMHSKLCGSCWLSQAVYNLPEIEYLIKESMEAESIHNNFLRIF